MSYSNYLRIKKTTPYYNFVRRIAFPSTRWTLAWLIIVNAFGIALAFFIAYLTLQGLLLGLFAGFFAFLLPTLISYLISSFITVKGDPLFFPRRVLALSLFGSILSAIVMMIGAVTSRIFASFPFPMYAFYLALFVVLPLRSIAAFSMSTASLTRRVAFSMSDPLACSIGLTLALRTSTIGLAATFALAIVVSFVFSFAFLIYVERRGIQILGVSPLKVFRAFLRDWLDGSFSKLENYLEIFGIDSTINICVLSFKSKGSGNVMGSLVVPGFHPGPFLNVGSSALPYMIKRMVESRTGGVAAVAHGISGHELNLVSQKENKKVIERVVTMLDLWTSQQGVSPVVRASAGHATATCQVFGESALVTMTVAPEDAEDIDREVGELLQSSATGFFKNVALVDAHNSIGKVTVLSREKLNDLAESAKRAMKATKGTTLQSFSLGVAHTLPRGISLKDGMGPGGIVVFWLKVGDEDFAYVTVDSNNMASGLRERLLIALKEIGAKDAEVMTSDTHMVNGIVSAKLGYNPLGAATDFEEIVSCIRNTAANAKRNLAPAEASMSCSELPVRTLGLSSLNQLTGFVLRTARLTFATLFPVVFVIAAISLVFLI